MGHGRRFPPPWMVEQIDGGWRVTDATGTPVAWVYARDDLAVSTHGNEWLTTDEAWRIASNIAKLPYFLLKLKP